MIKSDDHLKNFLQKNSYEMDSLKNWLREISLLDGKCCHKSKMSEFRTLLINSSDFTQEQLVILLKIFDEKLWGNAGNVYEVKSEGLVELQNQIFLFKENISNNYNKKNELKNNFLNFVVTQSTLLTLLIASVVFGRITLSLFNYINYADVILLISLWIIIFIVLHVVFDELKDQIWFKIMGIGSTILFVGAYFYLNFNKGFIFVSSIEFLGLIILLGLNGVLFGTYFFSSLYSLKEFEKYKNNKSKKLSIFYIVLAFFYYAILISGFYQAIKTIQIS